MSHYSVVFYQNQFEERINLAVIAYNDSQFYMVSTTNWHRINQFIENTIVVGQLESRLRSMEAWSHEKIVTTISAPAEPYQHILFTAPRASLLTDVQLLAYQLAHDFLPTRDKAFT